MSQNTLTKTTYKNDPFLKQFFACIPPETAATFTDNQLTELKRVFSNRFGNYHAVDIKFSILLPKRRFYQIMLIGKEKRLKKRLKYPIFQYGNRVILTISGLVIITSLMDTPCMVEIVPKIGQNSEPEKIHKVVQFLNKSFF
jgi:hypothetical protein